MDLQHCKYGLPPPGELLRAEILLEQRRERLVARTADRWYHILPPDLVSSAPTV